jgi:ferritin
MEAMNQQINHEMYSAYLYLSMSAHCVQSNLPGIAAWLRMQAKEEMEHAMKFYDFIEDRGGKVTLTAIGQPPAEFQSPLAIFEGALAHEQKVTRLINDIYGLAMKENDYASQVFLQWFISEQVEEEKNATAIVETLRMVGESKNGIFQVDHRLGKRSGDD